MGLPLRAMLCDVSYFAVSFESILSSAQFYWKSDRSLTLRRAAGLRGARANQTVVSPSSLALRSVCRIAADPTGHGTGES